MDGGEVDEKLLAEAMMANAFISTNIASRLRNSGGCGVSGNKSSADGGAVSPHQLGLTHRGNRKRLKFTYTYIYTASTPPHSHIPLMNLYAMQ
jgi:hypothetical protein